MKEFKGTSGEFSYRHNAASCVNSPDTDNYCIEIMSSSGVTDVAYLQSFNGDDQHSKEKTLANAKLFSAAPELLEALRFIISDCSRMIPKCAEDKAMKAINKALGEE